MSKIYYYKRNHGGDTVFSDDSKVLSFKEGIKKHWKLRREGHELWRLYLDLESDFEQIKQNFFTPEYWKNHSE